MLDKNSTMGFFDKCYFVEECQNDKCFFRQRDVHGLCIWTVAYENGSPEFKKQQNEIPKKLGVWKYPKLVLTDGTNCMYIKCKSFKTKKEDE
jgi:hypothetical protein